MKTITALAILYFVGASSHAFSAQILSFSPNAGAPADEIQLTGVGFSSGNLTVRFWNGGNGVVAKIVFINSDTIMTVLVPNGITTGPISIQQGSAQRFLSVGSFLAIGTGPFITGFFPAFGVAGTTVTISGVHLGNIKDVRFNGTHTSEFWPNSDGTIISTRVPVGGTSGPITVTTSSGRSNSPTSFIFPGPGPFVSGFLPDSGGAGTVVQIGGLNLAGTTKVTFNGQPGLQLAVLSDMLIQIQAPPNGTTGPIGVTTALGSTATSSNFFATPVITSFSPAHGVAGTQVRIAGQNFIGTMEVDFNGASATSLVVNNNSNLSAVVPAGVITGPISVATPAGVVTSTNNFNAIPVEALPVLAVALVLDKVQVSWPASLTNFVLQFQNGFSAEPHWAAVTTPPVIVGDMKFVIESRTSPARVYRLHR